MPILLEILRLIQRVGAGGEAFGSNGCVGGCVPLATRVLEVVA